MRSSLSIATLMLATAWAGEKHPAAVKAKLKEAEKADKAGDLSGRVFRMTLGE